MKLIQHRCYYWEEKEHLPPPFPLCSTIALLTWVQAACQLPAFPGLFFPWLWLPHHPRALHCYDEWAAACWWEVNVSKLPAAFTSAELDGKPNLQARAKQLNSKLPTAATANEPLTWHEPSRWRWHSTSLPAPSCQALGKGRAT